jgi:hypothetical protein
MMQRQARTATGPYERSGAHPTSPPFAETAFGLVALRQGYRENRCLPLSNSVYCLSATRKNKKVKRWFYIDIRKAMDSTADREEGIRGLPEDRILRTDFGREIVLDLSTPENEYTSLMYPLSQVFDWDHRARRMPQVL